MRAPVGEHSLLHLGEGRSYLVILLLCECCGQVLSRPVKMLADDPAHLLVARGPVPGGSVAPTAGSWPTGKSTRNEAMGLAMGSPTGR